MAKLALNGLPVNICMVQPTRLFYGCVNNYYERGGDFGGRENLLIEILANFLLTFSSMNVLRNCQNNVLERSELNGYVT